MLFKSPSQWEPKLTHTGLPPKKAPSQVCVRVLGKGAFMGREQRRGSLCPLITEGLEEGSLHWVMEPRVRGLRPQACPYPLSCPAYDPHAPWQSTAKILELTLTLKGNWRLSQSSPSFDRETEVQTGEGTRSVVSGLYVRQSEFPAAAPILFDPP